jgi:hypothetical protein
VPSSPGAPAENLSPVSADPDLARVVDAWPWLANAIKLGGFDKV